MGKVEPMSLKEVYEAAEKFTGWGSEFNHLIQFVD
jgi:hypothetical protein